VDWRFFQKNGEWFARETNTMPQWAGSCWYYLRFLDPANAQELVSKAAYDAWMPVDLYVGGSEHAVLHLLYARFWHKVLFDVGVVKDPEPFLKLVHQGIILGMAYRYYAVVSEGGEVLRALPGDEPGITPDAEGELRLSATGEKVQVRWAKEAEIEVRDGKPVHRELGVRLLGIAEKMAKSRGNSVSPDLVVEEFGADSLRLYEMFMGPLEQAKPWQSSGIQGVRRFLDRTDAIARRPLSDAALDPETAKLVHRTVQKIGRDIEVLSLNTAVSAMMILVNHLNGMEQPPREAVEKLVLCLSPFAPHLAEELWEHLGHPPSIANQPWPQFDPALTEDAVLEIAVQVNGKVRGRAALARDADEAAAKAAGLADPNVSKFIEGKTLKKLVYVPGKILNFIVT
jgi:leucyl-tRNA synthetase